ncbi:hypothetical protein Prudu_107S000800 [Prunus dulcis]|uniref:ABC transporter domain-containing protein n=1 Tax=Prunus dulcis TaxID=3755 RepID=A0A5H2XG89_PRUDU|nr:hypothetical protein Prudu_107S000800 [Prunus dulcis]
MATCFKQQPQPSMNNGDDSVILFSTSNSPEESTSPASSFYHSSPPPHHSSSNPTYKLTVQNLSHTFLPSKGFITTSFCHLVQKKPKPVSILKSVSFSATSSEILAIVGPSGTGKSTLLRIVSGRVKDNDFDPKCVSINDHQITSPAQLRKICGFVAQEDNLLPLLTVKETLMFTASLGSKVLVQKRGRIG